MKGEQQGLDEAMKRRQWQTTSARRHLTLKAASGKDVTLLLDVERNARQRLG